MKISSLTLPKYRDLSAPGDDISLILPGLIGVFDGATSALIAGESPGRIAAAAAASAVAGLTTSGEIFDMETGAICEAIRERMARNSCHIPSEINLATTMAAVAFDKSELRLMVIGDSGIRVNGNQVYCHLKKIDDVSTEARIAAFNILSGKYEGTDEIEMLTRRVAFMGLEQARTDGILSLQEADQVLATLDGAGIAQADRKTVEGYLLAGLKNQKSIANRNDVPLGYSVLNRDLIMHDDIIDVRLPRDEVRTLEIFSDGYFSMPEDEITIAAWEREFTAAEDRDFSKTSEFKSIKGSTSREFADDRSLIVATLH